jgi:hypothetical protein
VLISVSYFAGVAWFLYCEFTTPSEEDLLNSRDPEEQFFLDYFSFSDKTKIGKVIALTYFMFTSMTTVGLGDYHPRSNKERALSTWMLLFGAALTSFIMENLNTMLKRFNLINKNFEESDKLSLFLGTLNRFNQDQPLDKDYKKMIEEYFEYRWRMVRNTAVSDEADRDLLDQLPMVVQTQIFTDFLYKDFMTRYSLYFEDTHKSMAKSTHRKNVRRKSSNILGISDTIQLLQSCENTKVFQMIFLEFLEPMFLHPNKSFIKSDQYLDIIIFPMDFSVSIGYDANMLLYKKGILSKEGYAKTLVDKKT